MIAPFGTFVFTNSGHWRGIGRSVTTESNAREKWMTVQSDEGNCWAACSIRLSVYCTVVTVISTIVLTLGSTAFAERHCVSGTLSVIRGDPLPTSKVEPTMD